MEAAGLRPGQCLVVTDEHVAAHYREPLTEALRAAGWTPRTLVLPPGEATKSDEQLRRICDEALGWGIDRETPVVALGGGVIGDLAGFAAATLLRGVPLVHVPTSLVAQVDSSLGGKTGINHATGKNLLGAFWQPALVVADPDALQTLPAREWRGGLAEVVKHAVLEADGTLLSFLEQHDEAVAARDPDVVRELVPLAARVKARIVEDDEREAGRRAVLNFGHTLGHAVEQTLGYGRVTHGEAVALGMRAALVLSRRTAGLSDEGADRALRLTRLTGVPPDAARLSLGDLRPAMQSDKKNVAGTVRFVLLRDLGAPFVTGDVTDDDLAAAWNAACESVDGSAASGRQTADGGRRSLQPRGGSS
jgi:3-dehydroquinate synthase